MINNRVGSRIANQIWLCCALYVLSFVFTLLFLRQILVAPTALASAFLSAVATALLSAAISFHKDILARTSDESGTLDSLLIEILEQANSIKMLGAVLSDFHRADTFVFLDGIGELEPTKSIVFLASASKISTLPAGVVRQVYGYYAALESWRAELLRLPPVRLGKPADEWQAKDLRQGLIKVANNSLNAIETLLKNGAKSGSRNHLAIADEQIRLELKSTIDKLKT